MTERKRLGRIITIGLPKGGPGKTTLAFNLAGALVPKYKVLVVDLDPQGNLTKSFGFDRQTRAALEYTSYEVLLNPKKHPSFAIVETKAGVDLIPANRRMGGAEQELGKKYGREFLLQKALDQVRAEYDFIFIDPPPGIGLLLVNALVAGDDILVPVQLHSYSFDALEEFPETIELVQEVKPTLKIGGVICTYYATISRPVMARYFESKIREQYGDLVYKTTIPHNQRITEAPASGFPVSVYAATSPGAEAFQGLAVELEERYGQ